MSFASTAIQEILQRPLFRLADYLSSHGFPLEDATVDGDRSETSTTAAATSAAGAQTALSTVRPKATAEFLPFLASLYVVVPLTAPTLPTYSEVTCTQSQLVNRVIQRLLEDAWKKPNSMQRNPFVLTQGYRRLNSYSKSNGAVSSMHQVENYCPNTIVNFCKTKHWELLLQWIGETAMEFMLKETFLFQELPNQCFLQISGELLYLRMVPNQLLSQTATLGSTRLKPQMLQTLESQDATQSKAPLKKRKRDSDQRIPEAESFNSSLQSMTEIASSVEAQCDDKDLQQRARQEEKLNCEQAKPSPVYFNRTRILYGRPASHRVGLPFNHILLSAKSPLDVLDTIFPQWKGKGKNKKRRPRKTWRFNEAKRLGKRMLRLAQKCRFHVLLRRFCPHESSMFQQDLATDMDIDQFQTQAFDFDVSQGQEELDLVTKTVNPLSMFSTYRQVFSFVKSVVQRVIPRAFWGSQENEAVVFSGKCKGSCHSYQSAIDRFIRMRKFEKMSAKEAMCGFKITHCAWLEPPRMAKSQTKPAFVPTDLQRRQQMMEEFIAWLFEGFLIPLLQQTFYVTDTTPHKNRIFYYRHDLWQLISKPALDRFCSSIFTAVTPANLVQFVNNKDSGFSFVRLLPKEAGLRPIINLRRRIPLLERDASKFFPSVNFLLQNSFQVLNYEKSQNQDIMGGSVLGMNEIYANLKRFKMKLKGQFGECEQLYVDLSVVGYLLRSPPLYFAKVDVKGSFDSIHQANLLRILDEALNEEEYLVYKYCALFPSGDRIKRVFQKRALDSDEFPQFPKLAQRLAETMTMAIIMDTGYYAYEDRESILRTIESHITQNLIMVGKKLYRQTIGIPQGSILSTLLCSLFYGHLEKSKLSCLNIDQDGVFIVLHQIDLTPKIVLRFVDDFLYISLNKEKVTSFLRIMSQGFPEYGCNLNREKTLVNFDVQLDDWIPENMNQNGLCAEFPWCGLLVNTHSLRVTNDFSRLYGQYLSDSITVDYQSNMGRRMFSKLVQYLKPKSHAIFLDTDMHDRKTVLRNIYENSLLCAMRFHIYMDALPQQNNERFLMDTITQLVDAFFNISKARTRNPVSKTNGCRFAVEENECHWLVYTGFYDVLKRKQARYGEVLRRIQQIVDDKIPLERTRILKEVIRSSARQEILERVHF